MAKRGKHHAASKRRVPAGLLVRARRFASASAAVALPVALAACSSPMSEIPEPVMGEIACPMPTPPAPSASTSAVQQMMGAPPPLPLPPETK
jgi:hypothetical protein